MRRKSKLGSDELLVDIDPFEVTGEYITKADVAIGGQGAEVQFELNEKGAKLFSELTASNVPDPLNNIGHLLVTIVDDEAQTAAVIQSRITNRGRITGAADAAKLAYLLKSGPLSAKLNLISESK